MQIIGAFSLPTLWIIFLTYFFVACWTYGAGIPSGLFIPCLMIGASYGRFVATVFGYVQSEFYIYCIYMYMYMHYSVFKLLCMEIKFHRRFVTLST